MSTVGKWLVNQTPQSMLVKFIEEKKDIWEDYLDICVFAYNTARHDSTGYTPFELMFGRKPLLPIDIDVEKKSFKITTIKLQITLLLKQGKCREKFLK